ncbi:MAG: 30S ribosomal protein S13 [Candidatus Diapherotrites archaeon]|nr:30S ribosomal protein S13 [Candidatus Diapherotrites archaeon]
MEKEIRYIVRIANKDLDGKLPIFIALKGIKGISHRMAKNIAIAFEKENQVPFNSNIGLIPENLDKKLEEIVLHPEKHGIPKWCLNRRKDLETGEDMHMVMSDLDFGLRKDIQRMNETKSYKGLRHSWGLTVRGQRTKSTHRGKGPVVGVTKKDAKAAAAPAKKEEKKK